MPLTLQGFANAVGLSAPTVSQILNRKGRYSEATRKRVFAAAATLGYAPNASARAVVLGRFGSYALLLGAKPSSSLMPLGLLEGIESELAPRDLHLVIARLPDEELISAGRIPKILGQLMVDGLLINYNAAIPKRMIELIRLHEVPAVWINSRQPWNAVHPDDAQAGADIARAFLAAGRRRPAWLDFRVGATGASAHYSTAARRDGFCSALREAGIEARHLGHDGGIPFEDRLAAARAWLRAADRPDAIGTYGTEEAATLLLAAASEGIAIPADLSLATISDRGFETCGVRVDTWAIDGRGEGRLAVEGLHRLVAREARRFPASAIPFVHVPGTTIVG